MKTVEITVVFMATIEEEVPTGSLYVDIEPNRVNVMSIVGGIIGVKVGVCEAVETTEVNDLD